jgi:hypothetical protein
MTFSPHSLLRSLHRLLQEILSRLAQIERILEGRPKFTLRIGQAYLLFGYAGNLNSSFQPTEVYLTYYGDRMFIQLGAVGTFLGTVTASDASAVATANWQWIASDPAVTIANNPADPTGATVDVTVPASDTGTSFTLTATADASSPTEPTPQSVTASVTVNITPAPAPVTFTMSIVQQK